MSNNFTYGGNARLRARQERMARANKFGEGTDAQQQLRARRWARMRELATAVHIDLRMHASIPQQKSGRVVVSQHALYDLLLLANGEVPPERDVMGNRVSSDTSDLDPEETT